MPETVLPSQERPLRVLFAVREDLHDWPGGDTVQIVNTAGALAAMGVEVTISSDPDIDVSAFDCVHLWHLERVHETYVHLRRAVAQGKPVVLSPIYWPPDGRPRVVHGTCVVRARWWREDLKNVVRLLLGRSGRERRAVGSTLRPGWVNCRQEVLAAASLILPNSRAEAAILRQECPPKKTMTVVPNGVDAAACRAVLDEPAPGPREGVLCVGHFDGRKNQLALITALRNTDIPITFVGEGRRMHRRDYRRCRRYAKEEDRFLGSLPHRETLRWMRRARVHVCPSRFETPGLANLEAAAMGCSLVVPDCPPVREYFGDFATYFRPDDLSGLRDAVRAALDGSPDPRLAEMVVRDYTWEAAAEKTLQGYRQAIATCEKELPSGPPVTA